MSQKKGESGSSWYGLAGTGAVVASVSALSLLYFRYRKSEQKKERTRRIKKERKQREKEEERKKKIVPVQSQEEDVDDEGEPGEPGEPGEASESISAKQGEGEAFVSKAKTHQEESKGECGETEPNDTSKDSTAPVPVEGELTKEKLLEILNETATGMTYTIQQLAVHPSFRGTHGVSDEEMTKRLKEFYEQSVGRMRIEIFSKYNTSDEQCSQALQKYANDAEVAKVCLKIERINKALQLKQEPLSEAELATIPESLTVDRVIEMMNEMGKKMTQEQRAFMKEARSRTSNPMESEQMQKDMQAKMMEIQNTIFRKYEANEEIVTLAMQKYCSDPKLQHAIMSFQEKQQQGFQEMQNASD